MDLPSQAFIDALNYLLPGFFTAAILYNLTPSSRLAPFERVVEALIFTILVQAFLVPVRFGLVWAGTHFHAWGTWSEGVRLVWSVALAAALGLLLSHLANHDELHWLLRKIRITDQTSFPSEWYSAFAQNKKVKGYIVLHLVGERRLYGRPEEWPNAPDRGHFVITGAGWLVADEAIPPAGDARILVKATDVEMVDFLATDPAGKPPTPPRAPPPRKQSS